MTTANRGINRQQTALLIGIVLLVYMLWATPFVYPLKMLVVFFHEMSHGIAAVLTGGEIQRIELSPQLGGVCYTSGGWRFAITSAGYLGSMLWGGIILVAAARTRLDTHIMMGLGLFLLAMGLVYVRPIISFAFIFVFLSAGGMVLAGIYLGEKMNDFLLRLIGLTSCLYAILDIKSDAMDRDIPQSDASKIAEYIPLLGGYAVGAIWIVISIVVTAFFLWYAATSQVDEDA
jgi:hypothetical protein